MGIKRISASSKRIRIYGSSASSGSNNTFPKTLGPKAIRQHRAQEEADHKSRLEGKASFII
jgi:hypothetical protein